MNAIRNQIEDIAKALELAEEFAAMIRKQQQMALKQWLARAESSASPELRRFAEGIGRDEAAVELAMKEKLSNAPVEGQINRLKMIKRQMYGRAGFELLKARVLRAA